MAYTIERDTRTFTRHEHGEMCPSNKNRTPRVQRRRQRSVLANIPSDESADDLAGRVSKFTLRSPEDALEDHGATLAESDVSTLDDGDHVGTVTEKKDASLSSLDT